MNFERPVPVLQHNNIWFEPPLATEPPVDLPTRALQLQPQLQIPEPALSGPTFTFSLSLAGLAHAAVVALALYAAPHLAAGNAGSDLDAVGVDIVSADALESRRPMPTPGLSSPGPLDLTDGATPRETASLPPTEAPPLPSPVPMLSLPPEPVEPPPTAMTLPVDAPVIEKPKAEPDLQTVKEPTPEATPPAPVSAPEAPAPRGGVTALSAIDDPGHQGQTAARAAPGVLQAYGRALGEALRAVRPEGSTNLKVKGRVWVEFVVDPAGRLDSLAIMTSSGHARLDDLALASVRRATFPVPNRDMTREQRTFRLPYTFR